MFLCVCARPYVHLCRCIHHDSISGDKRNIQNRFKIGILVCACVCAHVYVYTMNKYHIIYTLQQRWRYRLLGMERVWSDSGSVGNRHCSPYASYCWYTHNTTIRTSTLSFFLPHIHSLTRLHVCVRTRFADFLRTYTCAGTNTHIHTHHRHSTSEQWEECY